MHPLRSITELKGAVEQAIFEFEELSVCVQEDLDDELYDYASTFQAMAQKLRPLLDELNDRVEYADQQGLAIMPQVMQLRTIIPFFSLIEAIDAACRQGVRGS